MQKVQKNGLMDNGLYSIFGLLPSADVCFHIRRRSSYVLSTMKEENKLYVL